MEELVAEGDVPLVKLREPATPRVGARRPCHPVMVEFWRPMFL